MKRIKTNNMITINYWSTPEMTVKKIKANGKVVKTIYYVSFSQKFSSVMTNDENAYYVSTCTINNNNQAVLEKVLCGKKPMGILYNIPQCNLSKLIDKIDISRFDIHYVKEEYTNNYKVFVAVKGKLRDLFNLKDLSADYKSNNININIKKYMNKEIKYFFDIWNENDIDDNIELWVKNLILGIPVENSISEYSLLVKKCE